MGRLTACGQCGHALRPGDRYCPSCGQPRDVSGTPPVPPDVLAAATALLLSGLAVMASGVLLCLLTAEDAESLGHGDGSFLWLVARLAIGVLALPVGYRIARLSGRVIRDGELHPVRLPSEVGQPRCGRCGAALPLPERYCPACGAGPRREAGPCAVCPPEAWAQTRLLPPLGGLAIAVGVLGAALGAWQKVTPGVYLADVAAVVAGLAAIVTWVWRREHWRR